MNPMVVDDVDGRVWVDGWTVRRWRMGWMMGWDGDGDVESWIGGSRGSGADGGAGESVRVCFDCAQFTAQHPKKEMN